MYFNSRVLIAEAKDLKTKNYYKNSFYTSLIKRLPKLKLVFSLLVKIFFDIIIHFLIVIAFDLAKILLLFLDCWSSFLILVILILIAKVLSFLQLVFFLLFLENLKKAKISSFLTSYHFSK